MYDAKQYFHDEPSNVLSIFSEPLPENVEITGQSSNTGTLNKTNVIALFFGTLASAQRTFLILLDETHISAMSWSLAPPVMSARMLSWLWESCTSKYTGVSLELQAKFAFTVLS